MGSRLRANPQLVDASLFGQHLSQEFGDRRHLGTLAVDQAERPQHVASLLDPAGPGHLQRHDIPDLPGVLRHLCLHESLSMTRDESRSQIVPGTPRRGRTGARRHCA
jgi:hypothetical protein